MPEIKNNFALPIAEKNNNITSKNNFVAPELKQDTELVSSKASLASMAYATPQINFGNKHEKAIQKVISGSTVSFEEFRNILLNLGFKEKGGNATSHFRFEKNGKTIGVPKPHGGENRVKRAYVDDLKDYLLTNSTTVH